MSEALREIEDLKKDYEFTLRTQGGFEFTKVFSALNLLDAVSKVESRYTGIYIKDVKIPRG